MLTNEELQKSCKDNDIWCLACGQDYMATLEDVLENNPGMDRDDFDTKATAMGLMLEESVDFGPLDEEMDTDEDHPDRMAARWDILDVLVERWVNGEYSGSAVKEMTLCQLDCTAMVAEKL